MTETADFDVALARAAFSQIADGLGSGLGQALEKKIGLAAETAALLEDSALRALLPGEAVTLGLQDADGAVSFLLVLESAAALNLALTGAKTEAEARTARLDKAGALDEAEGKVFDELGRKAIAGITQLAALGHTAFALDQLAEATWKSGKDPLQGSAMAAAKFAVTFEGEALGAGLLVLAPGLVESWKDNGRADAVAPGSVAQAASGEGLLIYGSKPEMAERVLTAAGCPMKALASIAELVSSFASEETSGVVVAVGRGDEHLLATVASLRDHPGCAAKSIVIVLEEASPWNVVRCGRLGLFAVLGPDFGAEDFNKRLLAAQSS